MESTDATKTSAAAETYGIQHDVEIHDATTYDATTDDADTTTTTDGNERDADTPNTIWINATATTVEDDVTVRVE